MYFPWIILVSLLKCLAELELQIRVSRIVFSQVLESKVYRFNLEVLKNILHLEIRLKTKKIDMDEV